MTRVKFENATIRDVIGKAARIAPTKGSAFDKAAGIVLEVDVEQQHVVVRSTNIEVFYMEITDVLEIDGPSITWRLPSSLLDGICAKLPISSGSAVNFENDGATLKIKQGRMVVNLRLMDPTYFPEWKAFDPTQLSPVSDFGGRLEQVQWAASKSSVPPMTGIHLNGQWAGATDSHRIALTPCEIPQLYEPVTIPAATFTPLMKSLGEVRIGQEDGQLLVMPDDATQIRAVIYPQPYPNLQRVMKRDETHAVFFKKEHLLEMIDQAMVIGGRDRTPMLKVIIGHEELAVLMEDQEMGLVGNVIELTAQATHDRHYIGFNPDNLKSGLQAAPNEDVTIYYSVGMSMKPVRIDGGSGYEVLIMPRDLNKKPEEK